MTPFTETCIKLHFHCTGALLHLPQDLTHISDKLMIHTGVAYPRYCDPLRTNMGQWTMPPSQWDITTISFCLFIVYDFECRPDILVNCQVGMGDTTNLCFLPTPSNTQPGLFMLILLTIQSILCSLIKQYVTVFKFII